MWNNATMKDEEQPFNHEQQPEVHVNIPNDSFNFVVPNGSVEGAKTKSFKEEGTSVKTSSPSSPVVKDKEIRHVKLHRAALVGDWKKAKKIFEKHKEDVKAIVEKEGGALLNIAAAAECSSFAENLVNLIEDPRLLSFKDKRGSTSFCLAAATGKLKLAMAMMAKNKELVKAMMDKNEDLAMIPDGNGSLPIVMAALFGHEDMVNYLYEATKDDLEVKDRIELLVTLVNNGLYDVALDLLKKDRGLAIGRARNDETVLHALARMPLKPSNLANQNQQGILKRCFKLSINEFHHKKLPGKARKLVKRLWKDVLLNFDNFEVSKFIDYPWQLIFVAAEHGNVEFLTILIREYPDLIFNVDEKGYTIFHYAVKYRHIEIFSLIHEMGSMKDFVASQIDDETGNNIFHMAAILPPSHRLNIVSGAALQLQRELLWFEEVCNIMHPLDANTKNKEGKTPRDLFSKEHEKLMDQGEKWMKETAESCMIVAALIATVVFAAAFTLPGGTKEDTGAPLFLRKASLTIFVISDAVSLVSSSCSILTFLSILTSLYREDDFKWWLPAKLLIGIVTLFLSIISMMVVFCATFFIVFKDAKLWHAFLATGIAAIPVILFIALQWSLYINLLRSTYGDSLFKPRNKLFSAKMRKAKESKKGK